VGIGSFLFHATLQYHAQLADELPMIYVGSMALWTLFDNKPGYGVASPRSIFLTAATVLFDILFSWTYIVYRHPIYHQVVFGATVVGTTARIWWILQKSEHAARIPARTKATIGTLFTIGAVLFATGFLLWNLDNGFCHSITRWKLSVGWPQAFALEGHSWWHILTGAGTYYMFAGIQYITLCTKDTSEKYGVYFAHGLPHLAPLGRIKAGAKRID